MTGIIYGLERKLNVVEIGPRLTMDRPREMLPYNVLTHDVVENDVDVCVIGSGAAGAIIASKLAIAGKQVVLIEKGSYVTSTEMNQREIDMMSLLWKNAGATFTDDLRLQVAQGQCLGGSTVINDAVCMQTPHLVRIEWRRIGVDISDDEWDSAIREIYSILQVQETVDHEMNKNAQKLMSACQAKGWLGWKNDRNCIDCKQCGFCHLGCHYATKQDMVVTYIRQAIEYNDTRIRQCNLRIYCNCSVDRLSHVPNNPTRVDGVEGTFIDRNGDAKYKIRVNPKVVVVSAGAIASPQILLKSNIALNKSGRNLTFHPASFLLGRFREQIRAFEGIPMAYTCHEFGVTNGIEDGYLIESVFLPIFQLSLGVPWLFEAQTAADLRRDFEHYAMAGVMIRDKPKGRLCLSDQGNAKIHYSLTDAERSKMAEGLQRLAELWFEARAEYVITGHADSDTAKLNSVNDIPKLVHAIKDSKKFARLQLASAHPQGGNTMGEDPNRCVVNSHCQVHGFENLFVCDASVFPSSVGVNPQITVMAIATMVANYIKDNWRQFDQTPVRHELGQTCNIKQPMYCSSDWLDVNFNRSENQRPIQTLHNVSPSQDSWIINRDTLDIYNNEHWIGFFPEDNKYVPLRNFGKFWKRFYCEDGITKGIVHPLAVSSVQIESSPYPSLPTTVLSLIDRIIDEILRRFPFLTTPAASNWVHTRFLRYEFENEGEVKAHPRYGQVIHLKYPKFPFVYDLIKIVGEHTVLGKMFVGKYPDGTPVFSFCMSRKYNADFFMTKEDHEKIFDNRFSDDATVSPKSGRWVVKLISNMADNPEVRIISINSNSDNHAVLSQLAWQLEDAFSTITGDVWRRLALLGIDPPNFERWSFEFRQVNNDFMVLKWLSPRLPPLPINVVPDSLIEELPYRQKQICIRFNMRREGEPCEQH